MIFPKPEKQKSDFFTQCHKFVVYHNQASRKATVPHTEKNNFTLCDSRESHCAANSKNNS